MFAKDLPIQRKLTMMPLGISGVVLILACVAFFTTDVLTFRHTTLKQLSILGEVVGNNSTAALAFENRDDAREVLGALKAERQIVAAALYDSQGKLFSQYPPEMPMAVFPPVVETSGFGFKDGYLAGFQPIVGGGNRRLGSLYLKADMGAIYERLRLYLIIAGLVIACSGLIAYVLSRSLHHQISGPILSLAETARAISDRRDYSVRAIKKGNDELGLLTDAFNQMLAQIHDQNGALLESESRLRAVLNSAMSAVVVLDSAGKTIDWNARAETVFGWTRAEALGRDMAGTVLPPRYREEYRSCLEHFLAAGEDPMFHQIMEHEALRRDGTEFPVEISMNPLRTGDTVTFCVFFTDITERKQAQKDLRELNEQLENRIRQRTAQLEAANKELESFSYSVSHDLRAPLRHISGFLNMLRKKAGPKLDATCQSYVDMIGESSKEMGNLIDDLLSFSKMGRAEMRASEVELRPLLDDIIANTAQETAGREIEWVIANDFPEIQADPAMLRQVLVNLISNALKYSRTRPLSRIEIGCQRGDGALDTFFIRDNGVGFDMAYANKLFGVFQRLHQTDEFEGTGVGLATVQRIITRHGGRTWAEGAVDQGATFYFSLPKSKANNYEQTKTDIISGGQFQGRATDPGRLRGIQLGQ